MGFEQAKRTIIISNYFYVQWQRKPDWKKRSNMHNYTLQYITTLLYCLYRRLQKYTCLKWSPNEKTMENHHSQGTPTFVNRPSKVVQFYTWLERLPCGTLSFSITSFPFGGSHEASACAHSLCPWLPILAMLPMLPVLPILPLPWFLRSSNSCAFRSSRPFSYPFRSSRSRSSSKFALAKVVAAVAQERKAAIAILSPVPATISGGLKLKGRAPPSTQVRQANKTKWITLWKNNIAFSFCYGFGYKP